MDRSPLIIGIDGGATKVSAWNVIYDQKMNTYALGTHNFSRAYNEIPGYVRDFTPVEIGQQLSEKATGNVYCTSEEIQQETVYVEACAQVVEEMHALFSGRPILLGLGMPGLKTADQRGIEVVANGPRMLRYADLLEDRLQRCGIELAAPLHHIGSDADYCGIGENFAADGSFRTVENAYYLGGGTGVADALKLQGKLVPFDLTKDWLAKTWEMQSEDGISLERYTSVGGMQSIYAELSKQSVDDLNAQKVYPLQLAEAAVAGDKAASRLFDRVQYQLAQLIFERITTLFCGWQNNFKFMNPNRPELATIHPFQDTVLDRVSLGQRLAELVESPAGKQVLFIPLKQTLAAAIKNASCLDDNAKNHYLNLDEILYISNLREAPALGAGIDANRQLRGEN